MNRKGEIIDIKYLLDLRCKSKGHLRLARIRIYVL